MLSDSVSNPEPARPAAWDLTGQSPVAPLVHHTRQTGHALLIVGAVGGLAGLLALSPLGILLAIASALAGARLVHLSQPSGATTGGQDRTAEPVPDTPWMPGTVLWKQGTALLSDSMAALAQGMAAVVETIAGIARGALKVLSCLVAGLGVGLITIGIFALRQPELWDYEVLRHIGPPLAPLALGAGIALVTAELLMLALFYRRRS